MNVLYSSAARADILDIRNHSIKIFSVRQADEMLS